MRAVRRYQNCQKKILYNYDTNRTKRTTKSTSITYISCICIIYSRNGLLLTDSDTAEILSREFAASFNTTRDRNYFHITIASFSELQLSQFNCHEELEWDAIHQCSNSNSSPDGISFKLLKAVAKFIVQPLNVIYQHSLYEDVFPRAWKHAIVFPLFKGRGNRSDAESYRPISLCSSLGKLLEKIVQVQLTYYLDENKLLCLSMVILMVGRHLLTCFVLMQRLLTFYHVIMLMT